MNAYRTGIIHLRPIHRHLSRERQENRDIDPKHNRVRVDPEPEFPQAEGPVGDVLASDAFDEEGADGDEVGDVEAEGGEGEDGVEGGRAADVDEGEEDDDDGYESDGAGGDAVFLVDLFGVCVSDPALAIGKLDLGLTYVREELGKGHAAITREGPG